MSEPMQQQTQQPWSLADALQREVYAHEWRGLQVITFCGDPKEVDATNILCSVPAHYPYDTQRIIASNLEHALNWERGHR